MKNTHTKVEDGEEFVTKAMLKSEFADFRVELLKDIQDMFEDFAAKIAKGFEGVYKRFDGVDQRFVTVEKRLDMIESEIKTTAKKGDILHLNEKFVPYYKFDELSMRVSTLEDKDANA